MHLSSNQPNSEFLSSVLRFWNFARTLSCAIAQFNFLFFLRALHELLFQQRWLFFVVMRYMYRYIESRTISEGLVLAQCDIWVERVL